MPKILSGRAPPPDTPKIELYQLERQPLKPVAKCPA